MKRALPLIPLVLFIFLNACGNGDFLSPEDRKALEQTFTAESWTPTLTPTPSNFDSLLFLYTLKSPLPEDIYLKNAQELENAMGARYDIADARIVHENNLIDRILEVKVSCFCNARSNHCCSPERAFAIVMRRMEYHNYNNGSLLRLVPGTVSKLKVYCVDHASEVGILVSDWSDVVEYLSGRINATQFGDRTNPE